MSATALSSSEMDSFNKQTEVKKLFLLKRRLIWSDYFEKYKFLTESLQLSDTCENEVKHIDVTNTTPRYHQAMGKQACQRHSKLRNLSKNLFNSTPANLRKAVTNENNMNTRVSAPRKQCEVRVLNIIPKRADGNKHNKNVTNIPMKQCVVKLTNIAIDKPKRKMVSSAFKRWNALEDAEIFTASTNQVEATNVHYDALKERKILNEVNVNKKNPERVTCTQAATQSVAKEETAGKVLTNCDHSKKKVKNRSNKQWPILMERNEMDKTNNRRECRNQNISTSSKSCACCFEDDCMQYINEFHKYEANPDAFMAKIQLMNRFTKSKYKAARFVLRLKMERGEQDDEEFEYIREIRDCQLDIMKKHFSASDMVLYDHYLDWLYPRRKKSQT